MSEKKIKGVECKFVVHIPTRNPEIPDFHMVKEVVHYEDGTLEPKIRLIKDYQRSVWVERPSGRDYKQKKEMQKLDRLIEYKCTQSNLAFTIAKALGVRFSPQDNVKKLCASPYVYGADIKSTCLIKNDYRVRYPDLESEWRVAGFDVETDVIHGHKEVIAASLVMLDRAVVVVVKSFVDHVPLLERRFQESCQKYLSDILEKYKIEPKLYVVDSVPELLKTIFQHAHEWRPDFVEIWNINFDIPKVLEMCEKYKIDPKDILCDPKIPKQLRVCKYIEGPSKKVTSSGKQIPINQAAQWHTLQLTASFYVIDGMCAYKHIRTGQQELFGGYSLENVLQTTLKRGKLKFDAADGYEELNWHTFMQSNYKVEYLVYNFWDSFSMLESDQVTKDLCFTLPSYSGISDFADFKSQPRRIVDALHFFFLARGYVIGTTGYQEKPEDIDDDVGMDDDDVLTSGEDGEDLEDETSQYANGDHTLGLKGWILTLQASNSVMGLKLLSDDNGFTNIRLLTYDIDAVSSYPTCTSVGNVSKTTTLTEVITVEGIEDNVFRMQNLNLVIGQANAIEYCENMFNAPSPEELLDLF